MAINLTKKSVVALCAIGAAAVGLLGLLALLVPQINNRLTPTPSEAAPPPESVELPPLVVTPGVITVGGSTLVTGSLVLPAEVKQPTLQLFDPTASKWKTLIPLTDDGKGADDHKKDGQFSGRLRFDESSGFVSVSVPAHKRSRGLATVPQPPLLRIAAHKRGQRGLVVSPSLQLSVASSVPASLAPDNGARPVVVMVPPTVDFVEGNGSSQLSLSRHTLDGYDVLIRTYPKDPNTPLLPWVQSSGIFPSLSSAVPTSLFTVGSMDALRYDVTSEGGYGPTFLLNDIPNQRAIYIDVSAADPNQDLFLDNMPEILSLVRSVRSE